MRAGGKSADALLLSMLSKGFKQRRFLSPIRNCEQPR